MTRRRFLDLAMVAVLILGGLWWWSNVYDTAKGRCDRGDASACAVWSAQGYPDPLRGTPLEP